MRDRSRTLVPASTSSYKYVYTTYNSDNTSTSTDMGPWTVSGSETTQATSDVVTPDFAVRCSRGEIINNDFSTSKLTITPPAPAQYTLRLERMVPGSLRGWEGSLRSGQSVWSPSRRKPLLTMDGAIQAQKKSEARDAAVQAAHANVDVSSMLAGATLAESRKTIDSFVSIGGRLMTIVRDARRLNIKGLQRQLRPSELADRYMELRYAVRPVIYDANGLVHAMSQNRAYDRFTARGSGSATYKTEDTIEDVEVAWGVLADVKRTLQYTVSARAGVLTHVEYSNTNVFGVDQLAETAWELMPFSFIVDWFVNVGQSIAAASPNSGVTQLASWVTTKESIVMTNTIVGSYAPADPYWDRTCSGLFSGVDKREELVLSRSKDPQVSYWPQVNVRLDTFKVLDLGIILSRMVGIR